MLRRCALGVWLGWLFVGLVHGHEFLGGAGTEREGLPLNESPVPIFFGEGATELNRLVGLLFTESLIPEEIQAALPSERKRNSQSDSEFYQDGWYFLKRKGEPTDRGVFGGDVRVSPRRGFNATDRLELLKLLAEFSTREKVDSKPPLRSPIGRLLVQWDVLSLWWHLERSKSDDKELLSAMARAVASLAQPEAELRSLPSGLNELSAFAFDSPTPTKVPYFPKNFDLAAPEKSGWLEVGRRSSTLFRADRTVRSSRVFLNAGDPATTRSVIDQAADVGAGKYSVPEGTKTILIQQMIGIDDHLNPIATDVVDEFRIRVMQEPKVLSHDNPTSSRDGSSHWIFMRTRYGSVRGDVPDFRFVPDTAQSLFLEYGTQKHAGFAAQCALCHRRTKTGGPDTSGIRVLSATAKPFVINGRDRLALAESEMKTVIERLKQRLDEAESEASAESKARSEKVDALPRTKPRPVRSEADRRNHAEELRALYGRPAEEWPKPNVDPDVAWKEIGHLPTMSHPIDNPHHAAKVKLGEALFYDPRLSGSGQIACASCHDSDLGWSDGRTTSFGHGRKLLARNAPSIRNAGYFSKLFWDGRATSLEDQAVKVLNNRDEMRSSESLVVDLLGKSSEYQAMFKAAFGDETSSMERVAQAIACFERTVVGGSSRFDAFIKGKPSILSDSELIGLDLFRGAARCMNCHHGPLFSDGDFHDIGLSNYGRRFEDLGRYRVTNDTGDAGKFRTPSLRDVTRTKPLMHNGLFELSVVLTLYNSGMPNVVKNERSDDEPVPKKSPRLKPLGLNKQDLADLAAFLGTLEEPHRRIEPPVLPSIED